MNRASRSPCEARGRREAAARRGYTAVEVLLSLTVLAIGAGAVMSMQKAAVQGNVDARKTDMANAIAREWLARIRRDATQWTLPTAGTALNGVNNIANAALLSHVGNGWSLPDDYVTQTPSISPGFDILGNDVPPNASPPPVFCVHVQETWLVNNAGAPQDNLMRVDLRVVWVRGINLTSPVHSPCDKANVAQVQNPDPTLYQTLYMTTAVRENGLP
jgi:prepilin-type N-terminal cleavage/methylation domain-containing protein